MQFIISGNQKGISCLSIYLSIYQFASGPPVTASPSLFTIVASLIASSDVKFFCFFALFTSFSRFTSGCPHCRLPPGDHVIIRLGLLWYDAVTGLVFPDVVKDCSGATQGYVPGVVYCNASMTAGMFIETINLLLYLPNYVTPQVKILQSYHFHCQSRPRSI